MTDETQGASAQPAFNHAYLVDLDPEDLEREIVKLTAELSRAGQLHAEAQRAAAYAKLQVDEIEATNRLALRQRHELAGQKVTEKALDAAMAALQPVGAAKRLHIEHAAEQQRLRAVVDALEMKGRMLDLLGRRAIAEIRLTPGVPGFGSVDFTRMPG